MLTPRVQPLAMNDDLQFLPPEIQGPSAWVGPQLVNRTDWVCHLAETEVAEIEAAANGLAVAPENLRHLSPRDFPLPTFGPRLQRLLGEVLDGRGFVLLRRL